MDNLVPYQNLNIFNIDTNNDGLEIAFPASNMASFLGPRFGKKSG